MKGEGMESRCGLGFWVNLAFFAWDKGFLFFLLLLRILSQGRSICFGCRASELSNLVTAYQC